MALLPLGKLEHLQLLCIKRLNGVVFSFLYEVLHARFLREDVPSFTNFHATCLRATPQHIQQSDFASLQKDSIL